MASAQPGHDASDESVEQFLMLNLERIGEDNHLADSGDRGKGGKKGTTEDRFVNKSMARTSEVDKRRAQKMAK
jgi:hypothetical protein